MLYNNVQQDYSGDLAAISSFKSYLGLQHQLTTLLIPTLTTGHQRYVLGQRETNMNMTSNIVK